MLRPWLFRVLLMIVGLTLMSACGRATLEPTPTPTKTPAAQTQSESPPTPTPMNVALEATNTPLPVAPTETPTRVTGDTAPYTGLPADNPEWLRRRPIFICINNDAVGRSAHHGLSYADLVYEYIVDGFTGTRITALFQSHDATRVGPVRSARMPNVWMTYMYDGVLACSGGSDEVRYLLKNEVGFPYLDADIDDPSNTRYFQNLGTDYRTRLQASTDGVRRWLTDRDLAKEWNRPGFQFSQEPPPNSSGNSTAIRIPYPGGSGVEWQYDPAQGGYIRFQGGQQQIDPASGTPILARNVIVIVAEHQLTDIVEDSLGTKGVDIQLYGFGAFRIFRDGFVYEGTWRADPENPPRWLGAGEVVVNLKPGQSWIQIVQQLEDISY